MLTTPTVVFTPPVVVLAMLAFLHRGPFAVVASMLLGVFLWTLGEYVVHRFVQHGGVLGGSYIENHRRHHQDPWPARHFVYPLGLTIPTVPFIFALCWLCTWDTWCAIAATAAELACYLGNEWVHFCAHRPVLVEGRPWLARLVENHLRHHHEDAKRHFGFFVVVWDRIFGTH
jgi:sterol desaturase/sphingolipid hydroxylase (fatty acid hydroxylase superfamily)